MFYTYLLESLSSSHFYTGYTNDLNSRLNYHNSGKVKWTSRYTPWKLKYYEKFASKEEALAREKYLKSHAGRVWLKKFVTGP